MNVRPERPGDRSAIREVVRLAFGRDEEARLVDALRDGGHARISLVAEEGDGNIVGHVLFSDLSVDGGSRFVALAPVAVVPGKQNEGIGSALVRAGIEASGDAGSESVFVLGEPGYYSRFGFSTEAARDFEVTYPKEYFIALELVEGSLAGKSGRIEYPMPFEAT